MSIETIKGLSFVGAYEVVVDNHGAAYADEIRSRVFFCVSGHVVGIYDHNDQSLVIEVNA